MPSNKVNKILGVDSDTINLTTTTSIQNKNRINDHHFHFTTPSYDKPPILPMPPTTSPINKSFTSFSSTSSLDLETKASESSSRSSYSSTPTPPPPPPPPPPQSHQVQHKVSPTFHTMARRNALDPSSPTIFLSHQNSKIMKIPDRTGKNLALHGSKSAASLSRDNNMEHLSRKERIDSYEKIVNKRVPFSSYVEEDEIVRDSVDSAYEPLVEKSVKIVNSPNHIINKQRQRSESFGNYARQNEINIIPNKKEMIYTGPITPNHQQQTFKVEQFSPSSSTSSNSKMSNDQRWTSSSGCSSGKWSDYTQDTSFTSTSMKAGLSSPISLNSFHGKTSFHGDNFGIVHQSERSDTERVMSPSYSSSHHHHHQQQPSTVSSTISQKYSPQYQNPELSSSRRTRLIDVKEFPLMRREAIRHCLMDENVIKVENSNKKGLIRKRQEANERNVVLTTNSRQIFEPLSAKLANLTGASTIGQARFSFNDCLGSETFVFLHCFKSCSSLTKEEERLMLTSNSFVAVAESSSSFNIDRRQTWALKIAGYSNSINLPKTRAEEQQQIQWTLQFDTKHRMLKWQTILRALILALNEADQVFRIGPPIHPIFHHQHSPYNQQQLQQKISLTSPHTSISSISTHASSVGGYQNISPTQEHFSGYVNAYRRLDSNSQPDRGNSITKEDEIKNQTFVSSLSALSLNSSNRTSKAFVESTNSRISIRSNESDLRDTDSKREHGLTRKGSSNLNCPLEAEIQITEDHASSNDYAGTVDSIRSQEVIQETFNGLEKTPIEIINASNPSTQALKPKRRKRSGSVDSSESGMKGFNLPLNENNSTPNLLIKSNKSNRILPPPPKYPPPSIPPPPAPLEESNGEEERGELEKEQEISKEVEITSNIRQMRSEIALAMASAASPRSISSISSFTALSEDYSVASSVYSFNTDTNEEEEDTTNQIKEKSKSAIKQQKPINSNKSTSTSTKQEFNDVDAMYALIDASYNISAYTAYSKNIIIRNPERIKRVSHFRGGEEQEVPLGFQFSKEPRKSVISISSSSFPISPTTMNFLSSSSSAIGSSMIINMYPVDESQQDEKEEGKFSSNSSIISHEDENIQNQNHHHHHEKLLAARQKAKFIRSNKTFQQPISPTNFIFPQQDDHQLSSNSNKNSLPSSSNNQKSSNRNDPAIGMAI